jgi:class 3 adenylate cyclase
MLELRSKSFDQPDEIISLPKLEGRIVVLGETHVARYVHEPEWRWSIDVKPLVGTPSCEYHHQGIVLSGRMLIITDEGVERTLAAGEVFEVPAGHDAMVLGEEPFVSIEFRGARDWARSRSRGERVLATLLFTDLVGSTELAQRLGDLKWKQTLAHHYESVRVQLDKFRGYEVKTTGDGFLAVFDGAARAVRCAAAIRDAARSDSLLVKAGVHSGEIERHTDGIHGVGVHVAARVMGLANAGEVLVSGATVAILEGADLVFADAGEHELKGVSGGRRLYRLVADHNAE